MTKDLGSFTGIRIGIATAKAFSDSLKIKCIGISSLETLCYNVKNCGFIGSIIDCKNDNCYFALFELENNEYTEIIEPCAIEIKDLNKMLSNLNELQNNILTFVGDGSTVYKEKIQSMFHDKNIVFCNYNEISSYNLGLAGFNKFSKNKITNDILPLYLKKPQAQRQLEEKISQNK